MITLTSAVFLVPFHGDFNVLAGVGFVMMVVYDDEKLPRHVFDSISTGFSMLFRLVADLIKMLFRSVADLIKMLFDLITMLFGSVADLTKGLYGGVTELVKGLYGGITGLVEGLYGGVTELVKGLFRGIGSAAGSLWTAIMSMFGDFRRAIIEVWPYAKIEDMAKLLSLAIFLVMAPAIAHELHTHLLVHYQYGMKRVIRFRDRWGTQPWQSLPLAIQGQGLCWRNPYTKAPSSIQDTASLRFCFGGQQLLVLACSCSLVSLPSMRTPAPPSCR